MPHTCTKCSRVNPDDAQYCYWDGIVLNGHAAKAGAKAAPAPVNLQGFSQPFVFPGGQQCKNFDQLAVGCSQNWSAALEMLKNGSLEKFLGGIGRADLAMAAKQAAQFPDRDRGLDQFLAKLPSKSLQEPKLAVEPMELNLGHLKCGEDKKFELKLRNQGQRLLYGQVSCENCPWITLGSGAGSQQKLFQFGSDLKIQVNVRGKHLRASNKPLEGKLNIESNGGVFSITVKADVPIRPFPDGVLAGARSPRQIAEKAKAHPKDAASAFEKGAVARWYKDNGWTYPVRGPSASGLGAVQQFFEALGLTPPPKVHCGEKHIQLQGIPGDPLTHGFEIKSDEKRPVYAHAVADQPWLEVGRARLNGRVATIPMRVPSVPDRPGEVLQAKLLVTANGNQKFVIPVTLRIGQGHNVMGFLPANAKAGALITTRGYKPKGMSPLHLLPAALLALCLVLIVVWDLLPRDVKAASKNWVGTDSGTVETKTAPALTPKDYVNRIQVQFTRESQRFGVVCTKLFDPRNPEKPKLLTRDERGFTNNTCFRVEGYEYLYGVEIPGVRWVREKGKLWKEVPVGEGNAQGRKWTSIMEVEFTRIRITQTIEIVIGEQTLLYDTALITYHIENRDSSPHTVGLRMMMDTYIGANDGVPFYIPPVMNEGRVEVPDHLVDTMEVFPQKKIPDFVQALETGNLNDPNATLAVVGLKLERFEPIERMVICRWPDNSEARWGGTGKVGDWEYKPMNELADRGKPKDSCIVLYWGEITMPPKSQRRLGFTYGLGRISGDRGDSEKVETAGGRMRLFVPPRVAPSATFPVTAYIKSSDANQTVKLSFPDGKLELASGQAAELKVPPPTAEGYSQVTWRVKAPKEAGTYKLQADAPGIGVATETVRVADSSIFN